MENSFWKQAADFLKNKKSARRWLVLFVCLAVAVTTGTFAALKLNGQAMTKKSLTCSYEVHKHTDGCYEKVDGEKTLVCGYADYVVHTHDSSCYDENDKLVCKLPEVKEHRHSEDCFENQKVLTCGREESEGHKHSDECYKVEKVLSCGKEESEGHTHDDSCYDAEGNLTCGKEESEGHTHSADCYQEEKTLVCGKEESEGHTHDDTCYTEEKVATCGNLELHTHTDECYETKEDAEDKDGDGKADGRPVCGKLELVKHEHDENCFEDVKTEAADGENDSPFTTTAADPEPEPTITPDSGNGEGSGTPDGNTPADGSGNDETQNNKDAEYHKDLGNFVGDINITDSDGNPIGDDGILYVGEDYHITIKFTEGGVQGNQFDDEGPLTYKIPNYFKVDPVNNRELNVLVDGNSVTIGHYTIDDNGILTITLTEEGKKALRESDNYHFDFDMDATAQTSPEGTGGDVKFDNTGKTFNFRVMDQPQVSVEKTGQYEEKADHMGGTLTYNVKTTVEHGNDIRDTVITDVLTPPQNSALKLDIVKAEDGKPDVTVTLNRDGNEVTLQEGTDYELVPVEDPANPYKTSFQVKLKDDVSAYAPLKEGDVLNAAYKYEVGFVEESAEVFWGNVVNDVTVTGTMPVKNPDDPNTTTDTPFEEHQGSNVEVYVTPPGDGIIYKTQEFSEKERKLHYTLYTLVPKGEWEPFYILDDMVVEFGGEKYNLKEFKDGGRVSDLTVSAVDVDDDAGNWSDNTGEQRRQSLEALKGEAKELTVYNMDRLWDPVPEKYDPKNMENCICLWLENNLKIVFGEWKFEQEVEKENGSWNYEKDRLIITEYDLDMSDELGELTLLDTSNYSSTIEKSASEVLLAGIRNTVHMRYDHYNPGYSVFFNNGERMNKTGKLDKNTNTIDYTVTLNASDTTVNKYFRDVNADWGAALIETGGDWNIEKMWEASMKAVFCDKLPDGWEYVPDTLAVTTRDKNNLELYFPFDSKKYNYSESQENGKEIIAPLVYFYNTEGTGWNNEVHDLFNTFNEDLVSLTFTYQLKATDAWLEAHAADVADAEISNHAEIRDKEEGPHWKADEVIHYSPARLTKTAKQVENTDLLQFTLDVNPYGVNLDPAKDYLFVTDTSKNLQIETETIQVLDQDGNSLTKKEGASVNDPVSGDEWGMISSTDGGSETEKEHQFKLMVPDGKALKICYDARIPKKGVDIPVSNEASIEGVERTKAGYEDALKVDRIAGSGGGDTYEMTVKKVDSVNPEKTLPGATFEYYIIRSGTGSALNETNSIEIGDKTYSCHTEENWKFTTGPDGTYRLAKDGAWKLEPGNYYILIETEAPAGYVLPEKPILFYYGFAENIDTVQYPGAVGMYGNELTVTNKAGTFELPETGGIGNTKTYTVGALLALAAIGALLYTTKKRRKEGN